MVNSKAKHYPTGRSPATGSFREKIIFGGMEYELYLCGLKTKSI